MAEQRFVAYVHLPTVSGVPVVLYAVIEQSDFVRGIRDVALFADEDCLDLAGDGHCFANRGFFL